MLFTRLIKPDWAKPLLANGNPNPSFKQEMQGENTIEGCNFTSEFLTQRNQEGYNVYFFPNHPSTDIYASGTKYLNGKVIDQFNYVFVDMDLKDGVYKTKQQFIDIVANFTLKPTMIVDSGNGVHAYWKIKDLTRDMCVLTQMALLNYFNTDASVWTVLQLMRLPQYFNTKQFGNFKLAHILENYSSGMIYTIDHFPKDIYTNLPPDKVTKVQNHLNRLDGKVEIQLEHEANIDELPDEFIDACLVNDDFFTLFKHPKEYNGDRSSADMKLANVLYNRNFTKKQALRVIANTQKALEKGVHRYEYAQLTIDKVYIDRTVNKFKTVSEILNQTGDVELPPQVYGPYFMDTGVLGHNWRKKEILGLIAGSGIGKTATALNMIFHMIKNNAANDDVFVFISLEMPKMSIIERWVKLVGKGSPLANKLYVIDNYNDEGLPRNINIQDVYEFCSDIKKASGRDIGAFVLDHIHLINPQVDLNRPSDFKIQTEADAGWNPVQTLTTGKITTLLKGLASALDTFGIILTQTTKAKGEGDLPIGKDGAYGISQYEWIVDYIITIWQPLMRVQHLTTTRFLAFQYAKIREKDKADKIFENDPKLLTYDMDSGILNITTSEEYQTFQQLLPEAIEARDAIKQKTHAQYSIQLDLTGLDEAIKNLGVIK